VNKHLILTKEQFKSLYPNIKVPNRIEVIEGDTYNVKINNNSLDLKIYDNDNLKYSIEYHMVNKFSIL